MAGRLETHRLCAEPAPSLFQELAWFGREFLAKCSAGRRAILSPSFEKLHFACARVADADLWCLRVVAYEFARALGVEKLVGKSFGILFQQQRAPASAQHIGTQHS